MNWILLLLEGGSFSQRPPCISLELLSRNEGNAWKTSHWIAFVLEPISIKGFFYTYDHFSYPILHFLIYRLYGHTSIVSNRKM